MAPKHPRRHTILHDMVGFKHDHHSISVSKKTPEKGNCDIGYLIDQWSNVKSTLGHTITPTFETKSGCRSIMHLKSKITNENI